VNAQSKIRYSISFDNAVHHEARIHVSFENLNNEVLEVRMSRSSPGRYAIHEFAKNVYDVKAVNGKGVELNISRPDPYQWNVAGHDGEVEFEYTLYANRAGGTYSGIDETHAHLNIPATFIWARGYEHRPIEVYFDIPEGSRWEVATQLNHLGGNYYAAPDFQYFMDSPVELAELKWEEEVVDGQAIRMAYHGTCQEGELKKYFSQVMDIVHEQKEVFGALPSFDFGEYTFLACFVPNASGDGMEHRNSTYVVYPKSNDLPLGNSGIGTMSHEFFHAWNVERLRPASLEPFDFERANMSGELWFAEGFTSYYTNLIRARAGQISQEDYVYSLGQVVSAVMNAPGNSHFSPVEMSYRAPFADAATSVDPTNQDNIFISYYSYGHVLGLALDLSLRSMDRGLDLDGYMRRLWTYYGAEEQPYNIRDLEDVLSEYAGDDFAKDFFYQFIYQGGMPNFGDLFEVVGVSFTSSLPGKVTLGVPVDIQNGLGILRMNALEGSALYLAGIDKEDILLSIGGVKLSSFSNIESLLDQFKPGQEVDVTLSRWGQTMSKNIVLQESADMVAKINEQADSIKNQRRSAWLLSKRGADSD
jgi:predicted metalloprotease with PDZ domain